MNLEFYIPIVNTCRCADFLESELNFESLKILVNLSAGSDNITKKIAEYGATEIF